ncbi:MAG: PorP/SprF family type IX secretion system membrane protein [Bacteroidales bacterium]|nr:PorP/SprF family type IX secretion system membrane protein [Bacteroidales bacterium]
MRKIIFYILLISTLEYVYCQDPQFSQFYSNPLYLAPSFAGAVEGSRIALVYRNQWWEATSPFRVYSVSYDHYFSTFNSGVGLLAYKDVAGSSGLGSLNVGLQYSYNFKVYNVVHIRPGLAFYYVEHGLSKGLLFIDDIIHESDGYTGAPDPSSQRSRDIDVGTSALVYTKKLWFGGAIDHLLTPSISLYASESNIPIKFSIFGGYEFRRKGKLLKPSDETMTFAFMYKQQQGIMQLDLGVYWYNYPLVLGLWYRGIPLVNSQRGDAMVFLVGIKTQQFNIGYSYDFTISNLLSSVHGSHEVAMTYKFLLPERKKKGTVPCPEF